MVPKQGILWKNSELWYVQELTEEEYQNWLENHKEAEVALVDRDKKLADSAERMEKGFELLGATG